jgi:hypothetical protein
MSGMLFERMTLSDDKKRNLFTVLFGWVTGGPIEDRHQELAEGLCDERTGVVLFADDGEPMLIGISDKSVKMLHHALEVCHVSLCVAGRAADKTIKAGEPRLSLRAELLNE